MSETEISPRFWRKNLANLITLGRIPLGFASFTCAVMVLLKSPHSVSYGFWGEVFLILAALTDHLDGYVARKMGAVSKIGPLADQVMDKIVYCIIFPTLSVGVFHVDGGERMPHVVLMLLLCITLLVRDHFVNFMRTVADRHNAPSGVESIGKLRTLVAFPTACLIYAYSFCSGEASDLLYFNSLMIWVKMLDPRYLIILEVSLFIINIVSAIHYTRRYGTYLLDELCEDDMASRRRLLSIFPNSLTLMNAVMGISAVALAFNGRYHLSFVMLMAASIFDKLDGAAARKLGLTEDITEGEKKITPGMLLDDLADAISFCLAPVLIALAYLHETPMQYAVWLYFFLGISRLIYFTFDPKPIPGFFKGVPSPAAALFVGAAVETAFVFAPEGGAGSFVIVVYLILALLMVSIPVKWVHFGRLMSESKFISRAMFTIIFCSMFTKYVGVIALILMTVYLLSPLFYKPKQTIDDTTPA